MDKATLLRKLETMIDDATNTRLWGTLEVTFQAGVPTVFRKISTERLTNEGGNPHGRQYEVRTNRQ